LRGETSPPLLTGALRKDFLKLILQKIALLSRLFKISKTGGESGKVCKNLANRYE